MQIDANFLQQICDTMRDNESFYINVDSLYSTLYSAYSKEALNKLIGHLCILQDDGYIEVFHDDSLALKGGKGTIMRLTSKGHGVCSCNK